MVTKDKKWWTFEVLGPWMIYNRFNREISCHTSPYHCTTASPHHCVSQSFALPPATKPVSHLPCPLPPNQSVICLAPYHHITASPHHCVSQSFALPPATKPVSHLPCPLPPNQSVICLVPYHCVTASLCHHVTASLHHCTTVPPRHRVTALVSHLPCPLPPHPASPHHRISQSFALPPATKQVSHLPCPLPPSQSVICLAPYHRITASLRHRITVPPHHCVSQSFALSPATKPVSHLPCPLPPSQSVMPPWVICLAPYHHVTVSYASPRHRITDVSQSFALPPATKPVSHLPCPLPPNQSVICLAPYHCITALVSHLPCPLPPSQSVICLAPCHQTSQSFALPPTTASPRHCITTSPHHHVTASLH